jgi:hypothetical protein
MLPFPKISFTVYFKGHGILPFHVKLNLAVCFKGHEILLIPKLNFTSGYRALEHCLFMGPWNTS